MTYRHETRDKLGPWFEAMIDERQIPFSKTHGTCECGKTSCAYADPRTGVMFAGFVMAFDYLAEREATVIMHRELHE